MAEDNMSDIINQFKNMLQSNHNSSDGNSENSSNSTSNDNPINISPEMIQNLASLLQSSQSQNGASSSAENDSSSHSFFSQNVGSSQSNSSEESNGSGIFSGNLDFETILKIKSIMETLNKKDDPRSNLLYSLKPYLRENRQKKLDQYVNLLKITQVTNLFKKEKGDET